MDKLDTVKRHVPTLLVTVLATAALASLYAGWTRLA